MTFDFSFYTPVSGSFNNWFVNILLEMTSQTEYFQTKLVKERKRDIFKSTEYPTEYGSVTVNLNTEGPRETSTSLV